jgi:hypothetical protein
MLETAMLKVFSTERLWTIVHDAFQIHGGAAYFTDRPCERMLRDARINQIGEGANEVLMSFIALTGARGPGLHLKDVSEASQRPWSGLGTISRFVSESVGLRLMSPAIPTRSLELEPYALRLGRLIGRFALDVQGTLIRYREEIVERQLEQERIAWAAMELFASACTLSRLDLELSHEHGEALPCATLFLHESLRNVARQLRELRASENDDASLREAADHLLGRMEPS